MGEGRCQTPALKCLPYGALGAKVEEQWQAVSRVLRMLLMHAATFVHGCSIDDPPVGFLGPHPFPEIVHEKVSVGQKLTSSTVTWQVRECPSSLCWWWVECHRALHPLSLSYVWGLKQLDLRVWAWSTTQLPWPEGSSGVLSRFPHGCASRCPWSNSWSLLYYLSRFGLSWYPVQRHFSLPRYQTCQYVPVTDEEALEGFQLLCLVWKGYPSRISHHRFCSEIGQNLDPENAVVCLSGRGDKDVVQVKDRWADAAREKLHAKTLTEKLKAIKKQLEREFCFHYIYGSRDHEDLMVSGETIYFFEDLKSLNYWSGYSFLDPVQRWTCYRKASLRSLAHRTSAGFGWLPAEAETGFAESWLLPAPLFSTGGGGAPYAKIWRR